MKKKKIFVFTLFALLVATYSIIPASAATGGWRSGWTLDLNGVSGVGTTNNSSASMFTLSVSATQVTNLVGSEVFNSVGKGVKISRNFWGTPGLNRSGMVLTEKATTHSPWFNA